MIGNLGETRLYVGNLNKRTSAVVLGRLFGTIGIVKSVKIPTDKNNCSKGVGYIEMETLEKAAIAVKTLNNSVLDGHNIQVQFDRRGSPAGTFSGSDRTRLYVENLNNNTSAETLGKLFEQFGVVKFVRIPTDDTNRSKGVGYVEMETLEEATIAINKLNNSTVDGHNIRVQFDRRTVARCRSPSGAGAGGGRTRLFVENLSHNTTAEMLGQLFEQAGIVKFARISTDENANRSKRVGYVEMETLEQAADAVHKLNNSALDGLSIHVQFDHRMGTGMGLGLRSSKSGGGSSAKQGDKK